MGADRRLRSRVVGRSSARTVRSRQGWQRPYNNANEVIREGLWLLQEQDEVRRRWREQIARGWAQAHVGQTRDGRGVMAEAGDRLKARATKKAIHDDQRAPEACADGAEAGQAPGPGPLTLSPRHQQSVQARGPKPDPRQSVL